MVNLYQLYFPISHLSSQPNKKGFCPSTFPHLQPNTNEENLNIFYLLTFSSFYNFLFFYFCISQPNGS